MRTWLSFSARVVPVDASQSHEVSGTERHHNCVDEVRDADDPRIDALLRPRFPGTPQVIAGARRWATLLAINPMSNEAYAFRGEDLKEALILANPAASMVMWSSPDQRGPEVRIR
jgi:hypothetical protein